MLALQRDSSCIILFVFYWLCLQLRVILSPIESRTYIFFFLPNDMVGYLRLMKERRNRFFTSLNLFSLTKMFSTQSDGSG